MGYYYLNVYGPNNGSWYNLIWNPLEPVSDDVYEKNDTPETAYEIPLDTWLGEMSGTGIQADEDWYKVYVPAGSERVLIELLFTSAEGNT